MEFFFVALFSFPVPALLVEGKADFLLEYLDKFEGHSVTLVATGSSDFGLSNKQIRQVSWYYEIILGKV